MNDPAWWDSSAVARPSPGASPRHPQPLLQANFNECGFTLQVGLCLSFPSPKCAARSQHEVAHF